MSRRHAQLHQKRWAAVRRFVLERDNWRCTDCGKAGRLEIDHISPMQKEPNQNPYDPHGLQALCRGCHFAKTARENESPETEGAKEWRALLQKMM